MHEDECLFVLRLYCPVNPLGSCWAQSVYLTTLLLGRLSPLSSIVLILTSETDNCPSWSGRERMTIENISRSICTKECCWSKGGLIRNLLIISRTPIQLNHRGRLQMDTPGRFSVPASDGYTWQIFCAFYQGKQLLSLPVFSWSDYMIQIVAINSHTKWQIVQIQISWLLLQKPTDLDLHCLQSQSISRFSRTRVKHFATCFVCMHQDNFCDIQTEQTDLLI